MTGTEINKILVVRFSSLGDVLLTTPVVQALKEKHPNTQIDFIVKKQFEDVYKFNPAVNNLIVFEKENSGELRDDIQSTKYDLIIDLQNNWRSRSLLKEISSKIIRFRKPTLKKLLLVWFKINLLKEKKSIVNRYADAADVILNEIGLQLFLPVDVKSKLTAEENYIGFCPGAKHFTKRWPAEYFIQLGKELSLLGYRIVLFGGKKEKELCAEISSRIDGSINLQNEDNLFQIAADMKKCKLIVTNDSGLMHTAAAVGTPVMVIFGSTVQEFGFSPYGVKSSILENNFLSCRPCSHIGRSDCPRKHFKCMKEVTPQGVLQSVQNFLLEL